MREIIIFYADDDEDDLLMFEDAINTISQNSEKVIRLHTHRNGENLIESIRSFTSRNKVVFLDLNMPLKSGFEFLEEIRSISETMETPIVIYSTSKDERNVQLSQELGANFYAYKPFDYKELLTMLSNVIHINWENNKGDYKNFIFNKLYT